ncbi:hypothetical protein [uncultured Aquimarina sp.]|uniref:hypothetical protein n=1 Tax=uncultured Aquimarina sp. TaxID=575652 RepID=UPI00262E841D|nr:hypothetical protein [uncultured Aquimarina sp.]
MKNKNKKKLGLEKIKIARLDNPQQITGGFNNINTTTSLQCPTTIPISITCDQSTKTLPVGSDNLP